jgi:hypothetical protein
MMCWNKKTLGLVAVAALAVLAFAPSAFGRVLPLLLVAACPLGMLLMARGMVGAGRTGEREGPAGRQSTTAPDAAQDEIAQLRQEVERLRAGEATVSPPLDAAPPSPARPSPGPSEVEPKPGER